MNSKHIPDYKSQIFGCRVSAEEHEISRVKKSVTKKQAANKCLHTKISCHSSKVEKEARWRSTFRHKKAKLNFFPLSSLLCGENCCSARKSNPSPDRVISTSRFLLPKKLYMHKKHELGSKLVTTSKILIAMEKINQNGSKADLLLGSILSPFRS